MALRCDIVNLFCKSCRVLQPCIFDIISISSIIHQDKPLIYRQVRTDQVNWDTGFYKVHLENSPNSEDKHIIYIKLLLCAWKEDKHTKPSKESKNLDLYMIQHIIIITIIIISCNPPGTMSSAYGDQDIGACWAPGDAAPLSTQQRVVPVQWWPCSQPVHPQQHLLLVRRAGAIKHGHLHRSHDTGKQLFVHICFQNTM